MKSLVSMITRIYVSMKKQNFYRPPKEQRSQCFQSCLSINNSVYRGSQLFSCTGPLPQSPLHRAFPPLYWDPTLAPYVQGSSSPLYMFKPVQIELHCTQTHPLPKDIFKLVHHEAGTIGKQVVGIQLKCLLVSKCTKLPVLASKYYVGNRKNELRKKFPLVVIGPEASAITV